MKARMAAVAALVVLAGGVKASDRLSLHVTPSVSSAPAVVRVRAMVAPDGGNRAIEIVADSGTFYRRSVIALDGDRAPRVTEVAFKGLPGGEYEVAAVLHNQDGGRLMETRHVKVVSMVGEF